MRIYLQKPGLQNQPPRYCQLMLQQDLLLGWTLIIETGAQGASGRIKRQYFPDWDAAEQALIAARDQNIQRGYRVMFVQGMPHEG